MMSHTLNKRIAAVRRRARAVLVLYGLSWVVGALVLSALILGGVDYLVHVQDRGLRVISTLCVTGATGLAAYLFLWPALTRRMSAVEIAKRIERRFPVLGDRLASTVEFLNQPEHQRGAGSAQLRRVVVSATEADLVGLRLTSVVRVRPTLWSVMAATAVCLPLAAALVFDPASARLTLARLANPLGSDTWPQLHHLQFQNPPGELAVGGTFEVELVDLGGQLPEQVRVLYRYDDGGDLPVIEEDQLVPLDGRLYARKEAVSRPFEYRAVGGDDDSMEWISLEVVEPPRIESVTIKLHPPAYTAWPVATSDKYIRALKRTRVQIAGTSTKPLTSAVLKRERGDDVPLEVSADGHGFALRADAPAGWSIEHSGKYWFELRDGGEVPGGNESKWDVRAIEDRPPRVAVERPAASVFVTAEAVLPLLIVAKDDLAVREISLHFSRSDRSQQGETEVRIEPAAGESVATIPPAAASGPDDATAGETRKIEYAWDLAPLELRPAAQVTYYATAADYQPQVGQSPSLRLTIITPHELEDRIAERQSFILGELAKVLKIERDARARGQELETQLDEVGRLRQEDVNQLQAAELSQRQVRRALSGPTDGILAHVDGLLAELKNNKVDSPDTLRRMGELRGAVAQLEKDPLPAIERDLTAALKGARAVLGGADSKNEVAASLKQAGRNQDHVIDALETLLGDLSKWDSYRQFYRDVGQIRRDQGEVEQRVRDAGRGTAEKKFQDGTLGKDFKDLTPQQQTDLGKLSRRQAELARRLEKTLADMRQMGGQLAEQDPIAADTISDALHLALKQGISGKMREAAGGVSQNRVSQAVAGQQQAGRDLQEMLDILQNRRENELGRLVKKLREAEKQLEDIRRRQEGLRKKMKQAADNPDEAQRRRELQRLAKEQRQLEEQARRLARQLMRLQAEGAGSSMARSAGKMSRSGQAGEQGDSGDAQQQAAAAEKDLEEAQQQLAERRRQAEIDLAREQLARLEDSLDSLHTRQQKAIDESLRLEGLRDSEGRLDRLTSVSVRDLAGQQQSLLVETQHLAEKLSAAAAFKLALDGVAGDMQRATVLLERLRTGETTRTAQRGALARLAQILAALKADEGEDGQGNPPGDSPGGPSGGGGIRSLAEVKLIKMMQEDLNRRTRLIEQARRETPQLTPAQENEYAALGEEQVRLADLVFDLSQPAKEPGQDDPEQLPDLEKELLPGGDLPPLNLEEK